jgi:hypothetical protein
LLQPASSAWHLNDERGFGAPTLSDKFLAGRDASASAPSTSLLEPFAQGRPGSPNQTCGDRRLLFCCTQTTSGLAARGQRSRFDSRRRTLWMLKLAIFMVRATSALRL